MVPAQDAGLVERFAEFFHQHYTEEIATLARNYPRDQQSLHIEWRDLHQFDADLADDYRRHPDRCREAAEEALHQFDVSLDQAHIRMHQLAETHDAGEINSTHLTQLVSLTGVVDRADAPTSDLQHAVFVCQRCGYKTRVPQSSGPDRQDPYQCEACERNGPFTLDPTESEFVDRQHIRLRERPMGGTTTADHESIIAILEDDLVAGVDDAQASAEFQEWLDVQSRFHDYSYRNTLLIKRQYPDATKVAGYRTWREEFDRHVQEGESAIWIWAPIITTQWSRVWELAELPRGQRL